MKTPTEEINGKAFFLNPPQELQTFETIIGRLIVAKMAIESKLMAATFLNEHEPFTEMELIGLSDTLSHVCRSLELSMKKMKGDA